MAHNLRFDKNVVFSAAKWRLGVDPRASWTWGKDVCTACKGAVKGKIPKLDSLYESIFSKPAPEGAHNALRDVEVLKDVFYAKFWPELKASAPAPAAAAPSGGTRRSKKSGRKTRRNYLSLGHIRF